MKSPTQRSGETKVLVIGLDGATFDLIGPWIDQGQLPVLGEIVHQGVRGQLQSVVPDNSVAAWTSFMTGKNPGKHGMLGFMRRMAGRYGKTLVNASLVHGETLWQILSQQDRRVIVLNVPNTYPPVAVNGLIVPGIPTPPSDTSPTYPRQLADELREEIGEYYFDPDCPVYDRIDEEQYLSIVRRATKNLARASLYLMRKYPWDLFMTVYTGPDRLQHFYWKHLDPTHPAHDPDRAAKHRADFLSYFKMLDRIIGDMVAQAGDDAMVILMSDHGFGKLSKRLNLNRWLIDRGWMVLRKQEDTREAYVQRPWAARLFRLIQRADRWDLRKKLAPARVRGRLFERFTGKVDWRHTKVYLGAQDKQSIYVNLVGRDPEGAIHPGPECEELLDQIAAELLDLVDPSTGERVIEQVIRKEEVLSGDHIHDAPELFVFTKDREYEIVELYDDSPLVLNSPSRSGQHRRNGIFMAAGNGISEGTELKGASIMDLLPTILYVMNLPVPDDVDGRVLTEAFTPEFVHSRKLRFVKAMETFPGAETSDVYSAVDEEEIEQRLKGLGYL